MPLRRTVPWVAGSVKRPAVTRTPRLARRQSQGDKGSVRLRSRTAGSCGAFKEADRGETGKAE